MSIRRRSLRLLSLMLFVALFGVGVVRAADGDDASQTLVGPSSGPSTPELTGDTLKGWPSSGTAGDVEFRVQPSPDRSGYLCVVARSTVVGNGAICASPAELGREGAIFGAQSGDGPMHVYGMAPLHATARGSGRDGAGSLTVSGPFFHGTIDGTPGREAVVAFSLADGTTATRSLGTIR